MFYAGIGLAATATENFEKTLNELVEKGKVTDSEAKKFFEEFNEKTAGKREEFDEKFKAFVEKLGYTRNTDVEELRKRVEELENQANKANKKAAAPVASTPQQ